MNLRNAVRVITLLPLAAYLLCCCFHAMLNDMNPTYLDCGKVVSKSNDEVAIKHGVRTELYLNIQFEKSGFQSIECNPTTYFSKEVGDHACFHLPNPTSFWYKLNSLVGAVTLFIGGAIFLFVFIGYLLPNGWGF
jgi:hypothetical protein